MTICLAGKTILLLTESKGTSSWVSAGQDRVIPGSRTPHRSAGQGQPGDQPGGHAVELAGGGLGRAGLNVFTGLQEFGKQRGGARRAIGGDRQVRHVLADLGGHYLG